MNAVKLLHTNASVYSANESERVSIKTKTQTCEKRQINLW